MSSATSGSTPPAFVLVHGGNNTSRYWERLQPLLHARSLAVDLPGRRDKPGDLSTLTLDQSASSVVADIDAAGIEGPIILVAHSSGALGVPRMAARLGDRLQRIVLAPGAVPPEGGCAADVMKPHHQARVRAWMEHLTAEGLPRTTPTEYGEPEKLRNAYGGRPLTDDELAFIADPRLLVTDSLSVYFDPVFWEPVRAVPLTYVRTLQDQPQPLALQDEFIAHLDWAEVIDLDSGHMPAITDAEELAAILNQLLAP